LSASEKSSVRELGVRRSFTRVMSIVDVWTFPPYRIGVPDSPRRSLA
jgi:hypothetical protein